MPVNEQSNNLDHIFKDHPINKLDRNLSLQGDNENTVNYTLEKYFRTVNPVGRFSLRKKISTNKSTGESIAKFPENINISTTYDPNECVTSNSNPASCQNSVSSQNKSIGKYNFKYL